MEAKARIEADVVELADEEESVDACVEREDFVEDGKMGGPAYSNQRRSTGRPRVARSRNSL